MRLDKALPMPGKGALIAFGSFPDGFPKERVGGVVFDVRTSPGFSSKDPNARIEVVLQSSDDHWIPIGTLPLAGLEDGWKTVGLSIPNHEHFASMKWLYSIRLQLATTQPVSGEIYINDAGVILR